MSAHGFAVGESGELLVGGVPLSRLAARVGGTPFYAYDRRLIGERVALLRRHLPAGIHLGYAVKANPMPAVVQHLAGLVDGFDVASAGEMQVALDTPLPPAAISFAGPGKSAAELCRAVAAGVTVNLESPSELDVLAECGARLGVVPRVAVRVNPDIELKGAGMRMGGGAKPFGIDAEAVPAVLARIAGLNLDFQGFHLFWGAQALQAELVGAAQRACLATALALAKHAPRPPRLINLGGGFGIPYTTKDSPLDLASVGADMAMLSEQLGRAFADCRLAVEFGRYLVGEAGIYVCRILDRKVSRGRTFLITDGGLHHHLAATGNFGQVVRRNYPMAIGSRMTETATETVTVVGRLCTPIDLLGDRVLLAPAQAGDLLAIFQSGAYGPSASPTAFLSHPLPSEVLL